MGKNGRFVLALNIPFTPPIEFANFSYLILKCDTVFTDPELMFVRLTETFHVHQESCPILSHIQNKFSFTTSVPSDYFFSTWGKKNEKVFWRCSIWQTGIFHVMFMSSLYLELQTTWWIS